MIKEVYDLNAIDAEAHYAKYGRYNDFPPNWREVTEAEIASESLAYIYTPRMIEYRQMGKLEPGGPALFSATLSHYHDGSGTAIHYDYWAKKIRWFRFEYCQHSYVEVSRPAGNRSGLHTSKCTKCGYRNSYDTSD